MTEAYIKKNFKKIFAFVLESSKYVIDDSEKINIIKKFLESGKFITSRNIDKYISFADEKEKFEIFDMLTEYKENFKK